MQIPTTKLGWGFSEWRSPNVGCFEHVFLQRWGERKYTCVSTQLTYKRVLSDCCENTRFWQGCYQALRHSWSGTLAGFVFPHHQVQKLLCLWWILLDVFVLLCLCGSDLQKASYQPSVPLNGGNPSKQINNTASGGWHSWTWWHWNNSSVFLIISQTLTSSLSNFPTKQPANRNTYILFALSLSPLAVELRPTVLGVALSLNGLERHAGMRDIRTSGRDAPRSKKKVKQLCRLSEGHLCFCPYLFWHVFFFWKQPFLNTLGRSVDQWLGEQLQLPSGKKTRTKRHCEKQAGSECGNRSELSIFVISKFSSFILSNPPTILKQTWNGMKKTISLDMQTWRQWRQWCNTS